MSVTKKTKFMQILCVLLMSTMGISIVLVSPPYGLLSLIGIVVAFAGIVLGHLFTELNQKE